MLAREALSRRVKHKCQGLQFLVHHLLGMISNLPSHHLKRFQLLKLKIEGRKGCVFTMKRSGLLGTPKVFLMEGVQASMPEMDVNFEEVQEEECIPSESSSELISQLAEITLYALLGNPSLGTMRVLGRINHQEIGRAHV